MPSDLLHVCAHSCMGAMFIGSGMMKIADPGSVLTMMRRARIPAAPLALAATIALELVGGSALAMHAALATVLPLLAGFVVLASLAVLVPQMRHAATRTPAAHHLLKNLALLGALAEVYAVHVRA